MAEPAEAIAPPKRRSVRTETAAASEGEKTQQATSKTAKEVNDKAKKARMGPQVEKAVDESELMEAAASAAEKDKAQEDGVIEVTNASKNGKNQKKSTKTKALLRNTTQEADGKIEKVAGLHFANGVTFTGGNLPKPLTLRTGHVALLDVPKEKLAKRPHVISLIFKKCNATCFKAIFVEACNDGSLGRSFELPLVNVCAVPTEKSRYDAAALVERAAEDRQRLLAAAAPKPQKPPRAKRPRSPSPPRSAHDAAVAGARTAELTGLIEQLTTCVAEARSLTNQLKEMKIKEQQVVDKLNARYEQLVDKLVGLRSLDH